MSDLEQKFSKAAASARSLPGKPDNDTLLKLYALYKQATDGDVHGKKPGLMDMVGRAKYEAWASLEGTGGQKAMKDYIALVDKLKARMG